jgi:riboflavin kinase
MHIQRDRDECEINYDELATLKQLALDGATEREMKISSSSLADDLDVSTQTASRRLQNLADAGYLKRLSVVDGQYVYVPDEGIEILREEFEEYNRIFSGPMVLELHGVVASGLGEGEHFVHLSGYREQFRERLSYDPYPGTLNVELSEESFRTKERMEEREPIRIDGWSDGDTRYGPVYCYAGRVETAEQTYEPVHVVRPERTRHNDEILEMIAPEELRLMLDLSDGEAITVHVERK